MRNFIFALIFLLSGGTIYIAFQMSRISTAEAKNIPENPYSINLSTPLENEYGLINIADLQTNISVDIRYASNDNFAGTPFYPYIAKAMLKSDTANKLKDANEEFYDLGYRLKIFDAYRPYRYQQLLRDTAKNIDPNWESFLADPKNGSNHNRGASVDVTLTDLHGKELNMPTNYDFFGQEASINYTGCTEKQKRNRELLAEVMVKHGFSRINSEWWHFDDSNCANYEILDVDFNEL